MILPFWILAFLSLLSSVLAEYNGSESNEVSFLEDIVNFLEDSQHLDTVEPHENEESDSEMSDEAEDPEEPPQMFRAAIKDFHFDIGFYIDLDKGKKSKFKKLFFTPSSYDDDCTYSGQSVEIGAERNVTPVILASTILVSRADPTTPNLFVSMPQEPGRMEDIDSTQLWLPRTINHIKGNFTARNRTYVRASLAPKWEARVGAVLASLLCGVFS